MARIRNIHPDAPTIPGFMQLSGYAKAAWLLLRMHCDDGGVFEWSPIALKARLLPADSVDMGELLGEMERAGLVRGFVAGGERFGAYRDFCRDQNPKKPKFRHPLPPDLQAFVGFSTGNEAGASVTVPNRFGTGPVPVPDRSPLESESTLESESDSFTAGARASAALVDEFLAAYPPGDRPWPKRAVAEALAAIVALGADPPSLVAAARRFRAVEERAGRLGQRFVRSPVKFLTGFEFEGYLQAAPPARAVAPPAANAPPEDSRWVAVKQRLAALVGPEMVASWIVPLAFAGVRDGKARLNAPTRFLAHRARTEHYDRLLAAFRAVDASVDALDIGVGVRAPASSPVTAPPAEPPKVSADVALRDETIALLTRGGVVKPGRALAAFARWGERLRDPGILAQLIGEAGERGMSGSRARDWIEQQVDARSHGPTLPFRPMTVKGRDGHSEQKDRGST